jgi:hypothetical protein
MGSILLKKYRICPKSLATFVSGKSDFLILENGLGYILGDFFTTRLVTLLFSGMLEKLQHGMFCGRNNNL